jgi:hypothetical protein
MRNNGRRIHKPSKFVLIVRSSFFPPALSLSAPIFDPDFLDQLDRREILLGAGDALDVEISFKQVFDPAIDVYVNDQNSFVIVKVIKPVPRA